MYPSNLRTRVGRSFMALILSVCLIMGSVPVQAAAVNANIAEGSYTIRNVGNGKYLNVHYNRNENNTNINVFAKDNTVGQDFYIDKKNGNYAMSPKCSTDGKVVNTYGTKSVEGSNVVLWQRTNNPTQQWIFEAVSGGYVIRSVDNQKFVMTAASNGNVQLSAYSSSNKNQIWQLEKPALPSPTPKPTPKPTAAPKPIINAAISEGYYTVRGVGSGKYLNVHYNRNDNNTNINVFAKDNTIGQDFYIDKKNGNYALTPKCSPDGKVVNTYGTKSTEGANIVLWQRTNNPTQQWIFEAVNGGYVIRSVDNQNLVLTTASNGNVQLSSYVSGNKNQLWLLEKPAAAAPTPTPKPTSAPAPTAAPKPIVNASIAAAYYTVRGIGSGKYLNVHYNRNENNTNINTFAKDGTIGQDFYIDKKNGNYAMTPKCSPDGKVVNTYGTKSTEGANIVLWERTNHSTQQWIFEAVSDGYVIRSVNNQNLVLTSASNGNVQLSSYVSGNKNQIWQLEKPAAAVSAETTAPGSTTSPKTETNTTPTQSDSTPKPTTANNTTSPQSDSATNPNAPDASTKPATDSATDANSVAKPTQPTSTPADSKQTNPLAPTNTTTVVTQKPGPLTVSASKSEYSSSDSIVINWTESAHATDYRLEIRNTKTGALVSGITLLGKSLKNLSYNIGRLPAGSYTYSMRGVNRLGTGLESASKRFTVLSSQPNTVKVQKITVSSASNNLSVDNNNTLNLLAQIEPANASNKAYSWSAESIDGTGKASITANGVLTAQNPGRIRVTARAEDGSKVSGSVEVTIAASNKSTLPGNINNSSFKLTDTNKKTLTKFIHGDTIVFNWQTSTNTAYYILEIYNSSGSSVYKSNAGLIPGTSTQFQLKPAVKKLAQGKYTCTLTPYNSVKTKGTTTKALAFEITNPSTSIRKEFIVPNRTYQTNILTEYSKYKEKTNTKVTLSNSGCFHASMSMVSTNLGAPTTPLDMYIANGNTVSMGDHGKVMQKASKNKVAFVKSISKPSQKTIKDQFSKYNGNVGVIINMKRPNVNVGYRIKNKQHFVVAVGYREYGDGRFEILIDDPAIPKTKGLVTYKTISNVSETRSQWKTSDIQNILIFKKS